MHNDIRIRDGGDKKSHSTRRRAKKRARPEIFYLFFYAFYGGLLLLTGLFWSFYISHQMNHEDHVYRTDFIGIYVGARIAATGHGAQLYDLDAQRAAMDLAILPQHRTSLMAFVYPGYVAMLLRPLGYISFDHATLLLRLLNASLASWIGWLLISRFAESARDRAVIVLAFLSFVPLQLTLWQNQLGLFPTLGIVQAILALRSNRPLRAGCWMLAGLLKPQLIAFPLLAFLLWRAWSALWPFFVGLSALLGVSFASLGWWIPRYLSFLGEYNRGGSSFSLWPVAMQNWRGLAYALFPLEGAAYWCLLVLLMGLSLAAVFALCFADKKGWTGRFAFSESREMRFAIVVLLGILTSPHLYLHDWVLFAPVGIALWKYLRGRGTPQAAGGASQILLVLLAGSPLVFWLSHFGPVRGPVQLVPCYMGLLTVIAFLTAQSSDSSSSGSITRHSE